MRIVIALVVVAVIGFFGSRMYQDKVAQEQIQQAAQQAAQQAEIAAKQAGVAAKQAAAQATAAATQAAEQAEHAAEQAQQAASDSARQLASLEVGGVDVGAEIKNMVQQATAALGSITDRTSAEAALPNLDGLKDKVSGVAAQGEQLSAEGKKLLASVISKALPPLKELAAKAGSIQGADTIKPSIDVMLAKLEAWANAQD